MFFIDWNSCMINNVINVGVNGVLMVEIVISMRLNKNKCFCLIKLLSFFVMGWVMVFVR